MIVVVVALASLVVSTSISFVSGWFGNFCRFFPPFFQNDYFSNNDSLLEVLSWVWVALNVFKILFNIYC